MNHVFLLSFSSFLLLMHLQAIRSGKGLARSHGNFLYLCTGSGVLWVSGTNGSGTDIHCVSGISILSILAWHTLVLVLFFFVGATSAVGLHIMHAFSARRSEYEKERTRMHTKWDERREEKLCMLVSIVMVRHCCVCL
jgi:hypothetical protein